MSLPQGLMGLKGLGLDVVPGLVWDPEKHVSWWRQWRFLKLTTMALPFLLGLGEPLGNELLCWASFTQVTAVHLMHICINWPKEDAGKQLLMGLQIHLLSHPACTFMTAFCLYSKRLWSKTFVSYVSGDGRRNMGEGCVCLHWGLFSSNQKLFFLVRSVILQSPCSSTQLILPFFQKA